MCSPRGDIQALVLSLTDDKSYIPILRKLGAEEQTKLLEIVDQASTSPPLPFNASVVMVIGPNSGFN